MGTRYYIDEKLDEGNIIDSFSCEITEDDTAETLFAKVENLAFEMFKVNFERILHGVNEFMEPSKKTYINDKNSNNNLEIPHDLPIEEVYDFVRAWSFKGRSKPYYLYNGKKLYLSLEN